MSPLPVATSSCSGTPTSISFSNLALILAIVYLLSILSRSILFADRTLIPGGIIIP
jgi:hypothetical protein